MIAGTSSPIFARAQAAAARSGSRRDLVGDRQQLMLLVEHGEEFAQILVSVHEAGIAFRL